MNHKNQLTALLTGLGCENTHSVLKLNTDEFREMGEKMREGLRLSLAPASVVIDYFINKNKEEGSG